MANPPIGRLYILHCSEEMKVNRTHGITAGDLERLGLAECIAGETEKDPEAFGLRWALIPEEHLDRVVEAVSDRYHSTYYPFEVVRDEPSDE